MTKTLSPQEIIPQAFPGIKDVDTLELVAAGRILSFPAGGVLCRENALEDTFYILLAGEVEVTKLINKTENRVLKVLESGSFFGEMALIHNSPRAATVTALSEVSVMEISKEDFQRVLASSASVSLALVREISARLRENDELAIEDLRLRAGELARAYQKLAEQDLSRREFLTTIAHELRTPLTAAGGFLQLIQNAPMSEEQLSKALASTARNIQQITSLVNDILFLQETDMILPKFQPVDISQLLDDVVDENAEKAIKKTISLKKDYPPTLPLISGDPRSLNRAISVLLDNAIKFSVEGNDAVISAFVDKNVLHIHITDNGIGISKEMLPRIFDRFYRLDRKGNQLFSGLGLGLAIARQVIRQHHGELELHSEEGLGTTAKIRLKLD